MYSNGANTSDRNAAAVVILVKKIGNINESMLCSIAFALSPVIRSFLKNFVKKCTLSELAIVIRMIGIDVFIMEKTNRSDPRSEEHTSELQSLVNLVCRLLLDK